MSLKALATPIQTTPLEFNLTVLTGKDKGAVYRLMAPEITIGRGSDNDIAFPDDPMCSRQHARIKMTPEGFKIEGLSEKNHLVIDGHQVEKAALNDGSLIELGNTRLKFNIIKNQIANNNGLPPTAHHPAHLQTAGPSGVAQPWAQSSPYPPQPRRPKAKAKTNPIRIIIGIVVVLGLYAAFSGDPVAKKKMIELRTNDAIQADIDAATKLAETTKLEKRPFANRSQAYKEAQGSYIRGFRDHQKGNYGRAMESFQACLSLVPEHQLCTRYLRLSQRKFNELTQYHMILGRKYRDQNQFAACSSAFTNVMVMIKDQNNKTYQEAKANYDICHAQSQGRF